MSSTLSFITALLWGGCIGISSWIFLYTFSKIRLEKNREMFKPVPLLFRLFMPFLPMVRPLVNENCSVPLYSAMNPVYKWLATMKSFRQLTLSVCG